MLQVINIMFEKWNLLQITVNDNCHPEVKITEIYLSFSPRGSCDSLDKPISVETLDKSLTFSWELWLDGKNIKLISHVWIRK